MLKKIAIVGPESTGKTTLARSLATHYQAPWVAEYAREYLNKLNHPYTQADVEAIAKGQLKLEDEQAASTNNLIFIDTNLLVIKVWMDHAYGETPQWILDELATRQCDLYLLTHYNIPYEPDPLREHPELREYFFEIYQQELETMGVPFEVINGKPEERIKQAIKAIHTYTKL